MFYPINNETYKVHDLCRSTVKTPYVLDYGYSDAICDRTFYDVLPSERELECMLSPKECEIRVPQLLFSNKDIADMIEFAKNQLSDFNEYKIGYSIGFNDAVKYGERKTFSIPGHYMLSYLVGYELGIYIGMTSKKRGITTCPDLESFGSLPTYRELRSAFLAQKQK